MQGEKSAWEHAKESGHENDSLAFSGEKDGIGSKGELEFQGDSEYYWNQEKKSGRNRGKCLQHLDDFAESHLRIEGHRYSKRRRQREPINLLLSTHSVTESKTVTLSQDSLNRNKLS